MTFQFPELESLMAMAEQTFEIKTFLQKHTHLITWLQESRQKLNELFVGDTIVLRMADHPDEPDAYDELMIVVQTRRDAREAFELLQQFDREWYLQSRYQHNIHNAFVHVEFV